MSEGSRRRWWRWGRREAEAPEAVTDTTEVLPPEAAADGETAEVVQRDAEAYAETAEVAPPEAETVATEQAPLDATPAETKGATTAEPPTGAPRRSWYRRLASGLGRSSSRLKTNIAAVFSRRKLDAESLEELEEVLIQADLGVEAASHLVAELGKGRFGKEVSEQEVRAALAGQIATILEPVARPLLLDPARRPHVVLVCGVNGTGKTTTIGKLAKQFRDGGEKVVLAAGDTFRAAAIEQLQIWGERTGAPVVVRPAGADAAGLAFDALERARAEAADVLLIDTAGRLHNKAALMDELAKIVRVLKKLDPEAPHDTLLVLDATTGQNARAQVETFSQMVPVTGLVVTKLDGTARGGVVVALARQFAIPVMALGVGEQVDDLRPFQARAFADALLGLEQD